MSSTLPEHPSVHAAEDQLPTVRLIGVALLVIAFSVFLCLVTWLVLNVRERGLRPGQQFPESHLPPPHTVAGVREEPFEMPHQKPSQRERARAVLDAFDWVDREEGIIRIPIERAMDLVAAPPAAPAPDGGTPP